jgi:hypothetical protein
MTAENQESGDRIQETTAIELSAGSDYFLLSVKYNSDNRIVEYSVSCLIEKIWISRTAD